MTDSSKQGQWFKQLQEAGIKTGKPVVEEPTLHPAFNWIWRAFTDLSYRRGVSFGGPVPITFADIEAYCRLRDIYLPSERDRLLRLLDVLDHEWMKVTYENISKESKSPKTADSPTGALPNIPKGPPPTKRASREVK